MPAPVDPFSPGSPVKTGGGADLLAADWTGSGAANGNGGVLGAAGGNGSPSHMAPQVLSDMLLHIMSQYARSFCRNHYCAQAAANPWDLSGLDPMAGGATGARPKNAVESLLGEHSNLVNLDNLTQVSSCLMNGLVLNPYSGP